MASRMTNCMMILMLAATLVATTMADDDPCAGSTTVTGNVAAGECLSYYYSCVGGSHPVERNCPDGLVYVESIDACDWPDNCDGQPGPNGDPDMLQCFGGDISSSGKEDVNGANWWEVRLDVEGLPVEVAAALGYSIEGGCSADPNLAWLPIRSLPQVNGIIRGARPGDIKITSMPDNSTAMVVRYLNCNIDLEMSCTKRLLDFVVVNDFIGTFHFQADYIVRVLENEAGEVVVRAGAFNCGVVEGEVYSPYQEGAIQASCQQLILDAAFTLELYSHTIELFAESQGLGNWTG